MRPLIVKQLDYDLTPVAGLVQVGHHLKRLEPVFKRIDRSKIGVRSCIDTFAIPGDMRLARRAVSPSSNCWRGL